MSYGLGCLPLASLFSAHLPTHEGDRGGHDGRPLRIPSSWFLSVDCCSLFSSLVGFSAFQVTGSDLFKAEPYVGAEPFYALSLAPDLSSLLSSLLSFILPQKVDLHAASLSIQGTSQISVLLLFKADFRTTKPLTTLFLYRSQGSPSRSTDHLARRSLVVHLGSVPLLGMAIPWSPNLTNWLLSLCIAAQIFVSLPIIIFPIRFCTELLCSSKLYKAQQCHELVFLPHHSTLAGHRTR